MAALLNSIRRDFAGLPVLCIPWLNLKHPMHPVQEALLYGKDPVTAEKDLPQGRSFPVRLARKLAASRSRMLRSMLCMANAVYLVFKIARVRWALRHPLRKLRSRKFDVIAKTWCFGNKRSADGRDFYYGDLQQRLSRRGISSLLLCGDANNINWIEFARAQVSTDRHETLPELCLTPMSAPLRVALQQIRISQRLIRSAPVPLAALDCLNPAVTQDALFYFIGQTVARIWRPHALLTLYEGHGWEKCLWWGARAEHPACQVVGYQHTVLFPEALSLIRPFVDDRRRSVPDIVLSLGDQTHKMLSGGHREHGVAVLRFGTFRHHGKDADNPPSPPKRTILVIPEGIASETIALFRFAYRCAQALRTHQFILRAHPQWPAANALSAIVEPIDSLPNIAISDRPSIEDDFQRASVMLYRGSSASLYGILGGLLPVYVSLRDTVESDPLYDLPSWHRRCTAPEELVELLADFEDSSSAKVQRDWQEAVGYINNYIVPVTDDSIERFVAAYRIAINGCAV